MIFKSKKNRILQLGLICLLFFGVTGWSIAQNPIPINGKIKKHTVDFALYELFYAPINQNDLNGAVARVNNQFLQINSDYVFHKNGKVSINGDNVFVTPPSNLPFLGNVELEPNGEIGLPAITYLFDNFENITTLEEASASSNNAAGSFSSDCINIEYHDPDGLFTDEHKMAIEAAIANISALLCCPGSGPTTIVFQPGLNDPLIPDDIEQTDDPELAAASPLFYNFQAADGCNHFSSNTFMASLLGETLPITGEPLHSGTIEVNVLQDWYTDPVDHTNPNPTMPGNLSTTHVDLHTVILHEMLHIIGMASRIGPDGMPLGGGYSPWDLFLEINEKPLLIRNYNVDPPCSDCCFTLEPNPDIDFPDEVIEASNNGEITVNGVEVCVQYIQQSNIDSSDGFNDEEIGLFLNMLSHLDTDCEVDPPCEFPYIAYSEICVGEINQTFTTDEITFFQELGYCTNTDQGIAESCYISLNDDGIYPVNLLDENGQSQILTIPIQELLANDAIPFNFSIDDFTIETSCGDASGIIVEQDGDFINIDGISEGLYTFSYQITSHLLECEGFCDIAEVSVYVRTEELSTDCSPEDCNLVCYGDFEDYIPNIIFEDENLISIGTGTAISQNPNVDPYTLAATPDIYQYNGNNWLSLVTGCETSNGLDDFQESFYFPLSPSVPDGCDIKISFQMTCNSSNPNPDMQLSLFGSEQAICSNPSYDGNNNTIECENGMPFYSIYTTPFINCSNTLFSAGIATPSFSPQTIEYTWPNMTGSDIGFITLIPSKHTSDWGNTVFIDNVVITTSCDYQLLIKEVTPIENLFACPGDEISLTYEVCLTGDGNPTDVTLTPSFENAPFGWGSVVPPDFLETVYNLIPNGPCKYVTMTVKFSDNLIPPVSVPITMNISNYDSEACNPEGDAITTDILILNEPTVNADFNAIVSCSEVSFVTLEPNSLGTIHEWDFGDGSYSTEISPSHTYDQTGIYTVSLTVTNECGNSSITNISSQTVVIDTEGPDASYTAVVDCDMVMVTPTSPQGNSIFTWDFGDGTTSTDYLPPTHTYSQNGNYTISLTVENECESITTQSIEIATEAPDASFTVVVDCDMVSVTPTSLEGNNTFIWDFGDGTTSIDHIPPTNIYPQNGSYIISLTVENECEISMTSQTVEIATEIPNTDFEEIIDCNVVSFTPTSPQGNNSFLWDFGDGNTNNTTYNPTHTFNGIDSYTVSFTASNECETSTTTETIEVVSELPDATFTQIIDCNLVCFTPTIEEETTTSFAWDFGDGATSTAYSPCNIYTESGIYTIQLEVTNECGTSTEEVTIEVTCVDNFVCPCENGGLNIDAGEGTLLSETALPPVFLDNTNNCLAISGLLIVDEGYFIQGGEIRMQPGSKIIVESPNILRLSGVGANGGMHGCVEMWNGIQVESGGGIALLGGNTIQDATTAITLRNNSSIYARNNVFDNNYVGIRTLNSASNQTILMPVPLEGNTFTCTNDDLLPPYAGQNSLIGIDIEDATFMVGSPNNPTLYTSNIFRDIQIGIKSHDSFVGVYNAEIENMTFPSSLTPTFGTPRGTGFYSDGGVSILEESTIRNAEDAFQSEAYWTIAKNNDDIDNVVRGITFRGNGNLIRVDDNNITNFNHYGISVSFPIGNSTPWVIDNELSSDNNGIGIQMAYITAVQGGTGRIQDNIVDMNGSGGGGIVLDNCRKMGLQNNVVSNLRGGVIALNNTIESELFDNNASSPATNYFPNYFTSMGGLNIFCCNTSTGGRYGFSFQSANPSTTFRNNTMNNASFGGLRIQASFGGQDYASNNWLNNTLVDALHEGDPDVILTSRFKVHTCNQPFWPLKISPTQTCPGTQLGNGATWFFADNDETQAVGCALDDLCEPIFSELDGLADDGGDTKKELKSDDIYTAQKTFLSGKNGEVVQWEQEYNLYRRLLLYPELITKDRDVEEFFREKKTSNLNAFISVDLGIEQSLTIEKEHQSRLDVIQERVFDLLENISQIDRDLVDAANETEMLQLQNRRMQALRKITKASIDLELVQEEMTERKLQIVEPLVAINDKIAPKDELEENQKIVNEVYLTTIAVGNYRLNFKEEEAMRVIANKCPWSNGHAVYQARSLYRLIDDVVSYDDNKLCEEGSEKKKELTTTVSLFDKPTDFTIYPNPTRNEVQVDWTIEETVNNDKIEIQILSVNGKILESITTEYLTGQHELQLNHLNEGIYFCRIIKDGIVSASQKLVIIK